MTLPVVEISTYMFNHDLCMYVYMYIFTSDIHVHAYVYISKPPHDVLVMA